MTPSDGNGLLSLFTGAVWICRAPRRISKTKWVYVRGKITDICWGGPDLTDTFERGKALDHQEKAYVDGASPLNYLTPSVRVLYALDPHHHKRLEQMRLIL